MPWCTPLTADQARLALQAALAVAAACTFAVVDPLWSHWGANGTWVVISVMVTLEPTMGGGIRKSFHRVLGTLAGGLAGLAALYLAFAAAGGKEWADGSVQMAVMVTVVQALFAAVLLVWKVQHPSYSYAYLVAVFTMPIIWVPGLRSSSGQVWPAIQRMLSILFGFGIAVLAQILVLPVFARRQLTERLAAAFEDSVALMYESAVNAGAQDSRDSGANSGSGGGSGADSNGATNGTGGGSSGKPGSKGKAAGNLTAKLQRQQRKKAAGLDSLLGPTAVELKLLPSPLSAAAFTSLVDAAATVGSTAVHLSAVLEAAHKNVAGTEHNPLPLHLEERIDAVASALAAAFAALAARLRGTLHSFCMQRWHLEKRVCAPCISRPAPKAAPNVPYMPPMPAALRHDSAAALAAAEAAYQQLLEAAHAEHSSLPPAAVALSESARAACIVLLQQAQLVAAVLGEAGVPEAAEDDGETVTRKASNGQQLQLSGSGVVVENGGKLAGEGKRGEDSV
ncbi:Aluminum activated malate transporter family [Chlorella sorokiniana]|uniref:Aluminum activated malate transporter family n=1 Tax=Chlorella sorokiniana TaxID=3076 RepID=A0A2P6TB55_CHLSO|nr:Aluminum activated malate transporter family [Chlorella sorokiniana]|eukprot:PRW05778.1 Aluminum activated malate transporter family [Chlorella sorokiniana]